jgi:glycerol-3-phosphate acyltransferase PlsY
VQHLWCFPEYFETFQGGAIVCPFLGWMFVLVPIGSGGFALFLILTQTQETIRRIL